MTIDISTLGRESSWEGVRAAVGGLGVSGFAAADTLQHLGADVVVLDDGDDEALREKATLLEILGVDVRIGPGSTATFPEGVDLFVTSPGWSPTTPLLAEAAARAVPVWGEVELAWRLRGEDAAPWLTVTGTNGKTTTVQMLESILRAQGLNALAVGNVGTPVLEAVMNPEPFDVLAVELSSYQLHWSQSISAQASAVLNLAPDHIDWHGGLDAYTADKARIYARTRVACVYNVQDPVTEHMVEEADVVEGCRAIGFTLGVPAAGMIGLVDDAIADRAYIAGRISNAAELGSVHDIGLTARVAAGGDADRVPAPHVVANALAAAALARAHGVDPRAVRDGLRGFTPDAHRIADVADIGGVRWVDDSKATNAHAAQASLQAFENVVWVAGGLAKGATFDDLVAAARDRLRAVVLIGADRDVVADALRRHAPDVPVVEVDTGETDPMDRVVEVAASLAREGDTVLLAPGCASMDQFRNYSARGDSFAAAVHRLRDRS
ncbi:UDP-N-acetylmuramoyl-L-alanine--D-glutamate ligase [Aeromicrobium fastidiosum]|uniref:UDP-N-acetylmuramoylalanine--D-glutamate ligase n=1 Tax=Aeromicrobium fastidiosum TaxID=52699 RepID=A0A641AN24_9ACTN|nr:UDP-N-acetylmuramoyl-L-alanine--D-glutamate ligase [Aeromicrobium fastidiosum]KAA1378678.1 UDP-N-acetylmuramoyl-L-alanine--D-glutamate ligase [Aeromicrobium fastidiosum]MBP2392335.1 UDP-N-acetylmuramoylalanine--D-glutamate ligase [Aeromicrobium fastidiosum]